ncbi:YihY/virulence factor BrkB family protein [Tissierella sp. Yu-01]|uniref:YihY/virulence factor BrkB family protein n=1 Tax=Tissierella sp. Yu-01 TaxID=3035694 RepID=UPI00240DAEF1|nr:YihY/virulence factor BrkB family protein [Tissierella sp. Yu-01]WFA08703.1 YihY/virulence factor BrkB family protein [Tissierella sp. Yu-01]
MEDFLRNILKYKPIIFLDNLIYRIGEDKIFAIGAQLSYFLILSIFPFLIVFLNIISYTSLVRMDLIYGFIQYLPLDIQNIISSFIKDLVINSSQQLLSIAALAGIWTASTGLTPVIRAINNAYDYEEKRSYFKLKGISILFTIALLILLSLVFVTLVLGEIIGKRLFEYMGKGEDFIGIWMNVRFIIPIVFMVYIFALLYKYSPCVEKGHSIKLSSSIPGGVFATFGWILTSTAFSAYVNNFGEYSTTYGSLGGMIVLLIWLYLSSIIIVLGGEFNATIEFFKINNYKVIEEKSVIYKLISKMSK